MSTDPTFRRDLYRGTARYYDEYRVPYPVALFDDLCARAGVGKGGRLLDLACGTGQIAFPLANRFEEVCAVDQEAESVAFGRAKAESLGVGNIRWMVDSAEALVPDGAFDLVAVGNAFHRLPRALVAERVASWLAPGGSLALLWGGPPWAGDLPWQEDLAALMDEWTDRVGAADRVPSNWQEALDNDPNPRVLEGAGLDYVGEYTFPVEHDWTVASVAGFLYSTSVLNRDALGDHADAFEADLAARLLERKPDGVFHQTLRFAYELARRPPARDT
ncbi:MAG TPA: methyltransferase domain-containing protein [Acidimicrobiia bacterium]